MAAFHKIYVSYVIALLEFLMVPKWLSYVYVNIVFGGRMKPYVNSKAGEEVPLFRGMRQGRTESMR
eukprot:5911836-Karenia_brevis.AAC.1